MKKLPHDSIPRIPVDGIAEAPRHPITLLLPDIRSAHNVGSAFRSADGACIEEIIVSGFTPGPDHKAALKTALGAHQFVPWRRAEDAVDLVNRYKHNGYTIAALEITDTPSAFDQLTELHFPMLLIAGNEVSGVDDELLSFCDLSLEIPQYGAKQSLNVSVAVGIALFNLVEQFRSFAPHSKKRTHD